MKTLSKMVLVSLAATLLGSGASFAEQVVRRIDHPNGQSTYVVVPRERAHRVPTIGVYAGETRTYAGERVLDGDVIVRSQPGMTDPQGRTMIPLHRGRGEVIYVPVQP
jgi:hypothetical protein